MGMLFISVLSNWFIHSYTKAVSPTATHDTYTRILATYTRVGIVWPDTRIDVASAARLSSWSRSDTSQYGIARSGEPNVAMFLVI